ncbi:unnamed protein product [Ilex paraguariensis]|uniref:MBD domain-containing protein n=1 Tax=Ilex paraguariensis TaxID=185542 RepID=A0ABC8UUC4_9AQUA
MSATRGMGALKGLPFTPKKGGTPRRNEIVFIAPTGEEIRSKRQLDQYLKSHPGGPSTSVFDWGTGDTPRRSARLTVKSKATESPESETPQKKQRKSSSKKGAKEEEEEEEEDADKEGEAAEDKEDAVAETKESTEVPMEDTENPGDHKEGDLIDEEVPGDKANVEEADKKNEGGIVVTEEAPTAEDNVKEAVLNAKENINEMSIDEPENQKTSNETSDTKEDESDNKSLPTPGLMDNNKEAENNLGEAEAPSQLALPNEAAFSVQEVETVKDAIPVVADATIEKASKDAKVGQQGQADNEIPAEPVASAEAAKPDDREKENQQTDDHAVSCKEAPHEPKTSQVSC